MHPAESDYYYMDQPGHDGVSIGALLEGVRRRVKLVVSLAVIGLACGFYLAWSATPIYQASATVQIERDAQKILDFESLFQADSTNDSFYQTQYQLIQSRTLARRVIEEQKLLEHPEFHIPPASRARSRDSDPGLMARLLARASRMLGAGAAREAAPQEESTPTPEVSEAHQVARLRIATNAFLSRLTVDPIRNTRLAMISWSAADPDLAARITNAIAETYVDMNLESRYEATAQTNELLKTSIEEIRGEIDTATDELETMREELDGGSAVATSLDDGPSVDSLRSRLTQVEFERLEEESYYEQLQRIEDPSSLPEVAENPAVQQRRQEYEQLETRYNDLSRRFTEEHPDVQHLVAQMDEQEGILRQEEQRVYNDLLNRARREYDAVAEREATLRDRLENALQGAWRRNQEQLELENLQMEIDNKRRILNTMIARQGETDVTASLQAMRAPNVRVAERATAPSAPSYPSTRYFVLVGGFFGLLLGLGAAVVREHLDDTVRTPDEIEMRLGLPNLATVPSLQDLGRRKLLGTGSTYTRYSAAYSGYRGSDLEYERDAMSNSTPELITMKYPKSGFSEAYRALRTRVLRNGNDGDLHSILVTSSKPREGKTTTAVNLATALARVGKRVLLVDADLRRPRLHRVFECDPRRGLVHLLDGRASLEKTVQATGEDGLWVLASGPSPPNPSELLTAEGTAGFLAQARDLFDVVVLDSAPILATVDPLVLASLVDGVLVVVRGGRTPMPMVDRACRQLEEVGGRIVGVLLNEGDTDIRSEAPRNRRERSTGAPTTAVVRVGENDQTPRPAI